MASRISEKPKRPPSRSHELIKTFMIASALIIAAFVVRSGGRGDSEVSMEPDLLQAGVSDYDAVKVPVPREVVPVGTQLRKVSFDIVSYPKNQLPVGAVTELTSVLDFETAAVLPAQLPIFQANLRSPGQSSNQVVDKIPPGMRAMTVSVDATTSVEGWAAAGSLVDVLLIKEDKTTVVAEKVKILSAERSTVPVEGNSAPSVPSTITLLVTQEQCLAINTAIPLGRIAFALRSAHDDQNWSEQTYTASSLNKRGASGDVSVSGYVVVKGDGKARSYALSEGKWIAADTKPSGFFVEGEKK